MAARCPVARLTDDLLVEILSRLPPKSICRCKAVSWTWRNLVSHPDHRGKIAQTLAGFFLVPDTVPVTAPVFANVSGTGLPLVSPTALDFLPKHQSIFLLDCCNGLLLCRFQETGQDGLHYFVCNPATKKWVRLPDTINAGKECETYLGFDPAVSDHFHVFEVFEDDYAGVVGVEVYSSETGQWVHKDNGWGDDISLVGRHSGAAFLNGCLHLLTMEDGVVVVDTEGKTWRTIHVPRRGHTVNTIGFIQQSQGCLRYATFAEEIDRRSVRTSIFEVNADAVRLEIYSLENYDTQEWIMKHSVEAPYIFGGKNVDLIQGFEWAAIHPQCNLIYLTLAWDNTLISYDMDRRQVQAICDLGYDAETPNMPYVPLYAELQSLK